MDNTLLLIAVVVIAIITYSFFKKKMRRDYLISKYGDENVVRKILEKKIWQGMSREQLIDSWGEPADIDEKIYKTKVKYTYKYAQSGRNRFRQRVFVEDNIVVGWDSK